MSNLLLFQAVFQAVQRIHPEILLSILLLSNPLVATFRSITRHSTGRSQSNQPASFPWNSFSDITSSSASHVPTWMPSIRPRHFLIGGWLSNFLLRQFQDTYPTAADRHKAIILTQGKHLMKEKNQFNHSSVRGVSVSHIGHSKLYSSSCITTQRLSKSICSTSHLKGGVLRCDHATVSDVKV